MEEDKMIQNTRASTKVKPLYVFPGNNAFSDQLQTPPGQNQDKPLFTIGIGSRYLPFNTANTGKSAPAVSVQKQDLATEQKASPTKTHGMIKSVSSPLLGLLMTQSPAPGVADVKGSGEKISNISEGPHRTVASLPSADTVMKIKEKGRGLSQSETKGVESVPSTMNNQEPSQRMSCSVPCSPSTSPRVLRKELAKAHGQIPINKYGGMFRGKAADIPMAKVNENGDEVNERRTDVSSLTTRLKDWMVKTPATSTTSKDMNVYAPTSF